jgi:hypothetical protein
MEKITSGLLVQPIRAYRAGASRRERLQIRVQGIGMAPGHGFVLKQQPTQQNQHYQQSQTALGRRSFIRFRVHFLSSFECPRLRVPHEIVQMGA